jgi:nucleoside-diphosphate-sugar epimerase
VRDVVTACVLALETETAVGEAFIIMSHPFRFDEAVPHLAEVSGLESVSVPRFVHRGGLMPNVKGSDRFPGYEIKLNKGVKTVIELTIVKPRKARDGS